MNRVRLLPIVIVAAAGLFVLKATQLIASGERIMAAEEPARETPRPPTRVEDLPKFARALVRHRIGEPSEHEITGSVDAKKSASKDEPANAEARKDDGARKPPEAGPAASPIAAPAAAAITAPASSSERAVLERLQERRGAIDDRAREIEMRESLLKAAERKLDGRINDLKEIEGRLDAGVKAEQSENDRQLKTVVVMYEAMKAKDAARVFDRLKLDVLVPIATAMKPARMSEILAAMAPEAAERLTVAMATRGLDQRQGQSATIGAQAAPAGELPRLDAQQARPRR